MKIETIISPEMRVDLFRILMYYRKHVSEMEPRSLAEEMGHERGLTQAALRDILDVLERGVAPAMDLEVIEAMKRLHDKVIPAWDREWEEAQ